MSFLSVIIIHVSTVHLTDLIVKPRGRKWDQDFIVIGYDQSETHFLAHLWGAYAIPVALSGVRRPSYVVCRLCPP